MNEMKLVSHSSVEQSISQEDFKPAVEKPAEQQQVEARQGERMRQSQPSYPFNDVVLKFVPDRESNKITVFVVDKTSKSVLRTIPPDEIKKLNAGELLELTA